MTFFSIFIHICQNSTAKYAQKNTNMTMKLGFVQTPVISMMIIGNPLFSNKTDSNNGSQSHK